jgi:hypothetical protein
MRLKGTCLSEVSGDTEIWLQKSKEDESLAKTPTADDTKQILSPNWTS